MTIIPVEYDEKHRHYHARDHIEHMLAVLELFKDDIADDTAYALMRVAIIYHDVVYRPKSGNNEELSVEAYRKAFEGFHDPLSMNVVEGLIMATKSPFTPYTELEKLMVYIDWSHFLADAQTLGNIERKMLREYQCYSFADYLAGRKHFLLATGMEVPDRLVGEFISQEQADKIKAGIKTSHDILMSFRPKIGIYLGSFNPFTKGHEHIVHKAEAVLDKVIIIQAVNNAKVGAIQAMLPDFYTEFYQTGMTGSGASVTEIVTGLMDNNADYFIIRGIRNGADLTVEQDYMGQIKDMDCPIPVLQFLCDIEFQRISSSASRAMEAVGYDIYRIK